MYDVGMGDYRCGFTVGVGVTKEEIAFFHQLGIEYGIDNFLGAMLLDKTVYKWEGKEKYVQFCFRCQWYMDFAVDMFKEGTNANRFFGMCCKEYRKSNKAGEPIFIESNIFSIDNWQEEIENLVGLITC